MELHKLESVNPRWDNYGLPAENMTDKEWQEKFELLKLYVNPHHESMKFLGGKYSRKTDSPENITNWQNYCWFINDVLREMRAGKHDYCYYGYQVIELLRFHPNDLCTKFCDGYWEVWLDNARQIARAS